MVPHRIQRSRAKGWRRPSAAVYVGRPTWWGNPFVHADPAEAVAAYRRLVSPGTHTFSIEPGGLQFARRVHPFTVDWAYSAWVANNVAALRGRNLVCWCPLDKPCHADVLLELANPGLRCEAAGV